MCNDVARSTVWDVVSAIADVYVRNFWPLLSFKCTFAKSQSKSSAVTVMTRDTAAKFVSDKIVHAIVCQLTWSLQWKKNARQMRRSPLPWELPGKFFDCMALPYPGQRLSFMTSSFPGVPRSCTSLLPRTAELVQDRLLRIAGTRRRTLRGEYGVCFFFYYQIINNFIDNAQ